MRTADFDFQLPVELIAQTPAEPRDSSRLMVVDKTNQTIAHKHFRDIVDYLGENDIVVWNNSKVFKARLKGRIFLDEVTDDVDDAREAKLHPTDEILNEKLVEVFLVRPSENKGVWRVLAKPGKKLRLGTKVVFAPDFACEVIAKENDGTILVQFDDEPATVREKANKYGSVPTPPYIAEQPNEKSEQQYQTVYAKHEGSVAAPTAGFHFTPALIEQLQQKGVQFAEVTLHVGLGTFLPVKTETVEDHTMHSEWVEVSAQTASLINEAKQNGKRIVAVGTTTLRTLEGVAKACGGKVAAFSGDINIFIYPGYTFLVVDALITNFHLPQSSLIMLVCAFAGDKLDRHSRGEGREFMLRCYGEAIQEKYRFYSFGDAMFIN